MDQDPKFVPGKIFVRGLSPATGDAQLKMYFSKYGNVTECEVKEDPIRSRKRGIAFVTFYNPSVVDIVIAKHLIDGREVKVHRFLVKWNGVDKFRTHRFYVYGIPEHVSPDYLKNFFGHFGEVISCSIESEEGYGCIYFGSTKQVDMIF